MINTVKNKHGDFVFVTEEIFSNDFFVRIILKVYFNPMHGVAVSGLAWGGKFTPPSVPLKHTVCFTKLLTQF